MAKYTVTAPAKGYNGQRAGVQFSNGVASGVDDQDERQARALAYFRRRGYKVESERQAKAAAKGKAPAETPKTPADSGNAPPPDTGTGEGADTKPNQPGE